MENREAKTALFDQLAVVGKAFGSAKRLELIDLLSQGERSVESLAREAGLGVSTASAHLQVLKLSGLVTTRREGTRVHYSSRERTSRRSTPPCAPSPACTPPTSTGRSSPTSASAADTDAGVGEISARTAPRVSTPATSSCSTCAHPRSSPRPHPRRPVGPVGRLTEDLVAVAGLDQDADVVAYCRGAYCVLAHERSGCSPRRATERAASRTACWSGAPKESRGGRCMIPLRSGAPPPLGRRRRSLRCSTRC